eukprot:TRINITY_DN859_c0_g1_i3.p2 TRINITY_DN859_c0_g1~~TRINITY_DN859_c0_g1_i3.p2  ORF type:complete len:112 (-),score=21.52 TRINITY_DN859_c0_g1_i3:172-507(-)
MTGSISMLAAAGSTSVRAAAATTFVRAVAATEASMRAAVVSHWLAPIAFSSPDSGRQVAAATRLTPTATTASVRDIVPMVGGGRDCEQKLLIKRNAGVGGVEEWTDNSVPQ